LFYGEFSVELRLKLLNRTGDKGLSILVLRLVENEVNDGERNGVE
jgi:hypothetical protein